MHVKHIFLNGLGVQKDGVSHEVCFGQEMPTINMNSLERDLKRIIGKFALIKESRSTVLLAVDLISSYPLFYTVTDDTIFLSDDAVLISKAAKIPVNPNNCFEFLKTGYVTERETLFYGVYCLLPGSYVIINKSTGTVIEKQWAEINYTQSSTCSERELINRFDQHLLEVFSDLTAKLDGRTALIPLSGGCDSRTVVAYLKKLNYKNVICFSYGRKGNWESERSEAIAKKILYPWIFVEYNDEVWKSFFSSDQYNRFLDYSCRGRAIGCLQALPAVLFIREHQLVPENSVVIPGHSLDFTMGSHLSADQMSWNKEALVNYIIKTHYCLRDKQSELGNIEKWKKNIPEDISGVECYNAYMHWEWINRQARFIANDVRAYEFAGFDYELPMWDARIVEFAASLKIENLINRHFQYRFTSEMIDSMINISYNYSEQEVKASHFKRLLKRSFLVKKMLKKRELYQRRHYDTNGFLSWLSNKEYSEYVKLFGESFNLNSIEADDYIELIKKT